MKYHFNKSELLNKKQPEELGLQYGTVRRFEPLDAFEIRSVGEEICLVVTNGAVQFDTTDENGQAEYRDMVYIPRDTTVKLTPLSSAPVVIGFGAPAHRDTRFAHVRFADIDRNPEAHKIYGNRETNCYRDVWHFINDDFNACRLMTGLCLGEAGGWTAWPPHEHSEEREELYVYFGMENGFGVQCVYEDLSHPVLVDIVRDGDLVTIPRGFHPNAGSPAGPVSYIYCMVSKKPDDRKFMDLRVQEGFAGEFK